MAKGVLGIIICPMNDDYLIHSICTDREVGRIVLLQNKHSDGIKAKLESRGVQFDIVPEYFFDNGNMVFDKKILNVVIKTNDLGLHAEPKDLRDYIEAEITELQPLVDAVGLYYGICGNFAWDITEWCKERGYKPTAVFRALDGRVCDDCVAIAIGGTEKYKQLEREYKGMFYVTPAIADNWVAFVGAGDIGKQLKSISKETLDGLGFFELWSSGIQQPGLGIVRVAHLEERRLLLEVYIQSMRISGSESVALYLVVERRRCTCDVVKILALDAKLRKA